DDPFPGRRRAVHDELDEAVGRCRAAAAEAAAERVRTLACVADAVAVVVGLIGIGDVWAQVHRIADTVAVAVAGRARLADAGRAGVAVGAGVSVVARGPVGKSRRAALARRGIADPGRVAVVGSVARDLVVADADARRARVGRGACVAVVARRAVGARRIRAGAGRRIADACEVTGVGRLAHDRLGVDAGSRRADVRPRARVAAVADGAIGLRLHAALVRRLVAHRLVAGVAEARAVARGAVADAVGADVVDGAEEAVVTRRRVRDVLAAAGAVAHVVRADVVVARARARGGLELARRRAAVAADGVAVVALLARIDGPVAAAPDVEHRNGVVRVAGDVDVRAIGAHRDGLWGLHPVDRAALAFPSEVRQRAGSGVAPERGDGIIDGTRDVDVRAIRAHHDAARAVDAVHPGHTVLFGLDERQPPGRRVALEGDHGVGVATRRVQARAVHTERADAAETGDAVRAVALDLDERPVPRRRVPGEDGDRRLERPGSIDVRAVAAHDDRLRAEEAADTRGIVAVHLDEREEPARRVTAEHRERIVVPAGDVDVRAVGAHGERLGPVEPVHALLPVVLRVAERETAGRLITREARERIPGRGRNVGVRTVRADRHRVRALKTVDPADAVTLRLDERQR